MHEQSLMVDLMRKINTIGEEQQAKTIPCFKVRLGALSYISANHFREHFAQAAKGSCSGKVQLGIEVLTDLNEPPYAQDILLNNFKVED